MPDEDDQRAGMTDPDREKALDWASSQVSWAVSELAANLIRVVRGAGRPHTVGREAAELLEACEAFHEAAGAWPSTYDLAEMLSIRPEEEWRSQLPAAELDRTAALEQIIRGALQIAASRLVGQRTQESMGEHEMHKGIRRLEAALVEKRRVREAASAPGPGLRSGQRGRAKTKR